MEKRFKQIEEILLRVKDKDLTAGEIEEIERETKKFREELRKSRIIPPDVWFTIFDAD